MTSPAIIPNGTKPSSNSPSSFLFKSSTPLKILKKQPSQFSALAHEVRNPLSNINLAIEMLKSLIINDDQKIFLDIIMRASGRINEIVIDILAYNQTDEMQAEKHCIHQLLDEVLAMTEDRLRLKNIAINKDYDAWEPKIILNRPKMKIALTNIIINAIDAMTPGKGELKLVTKSIDGGYAIHIEDNGCGISKENLKKIFKPYFTNKTNGLGVGLASTYDILQSNHVGVNVESEEGEGTRFILLFKKQYNSDTSTNSAMNKTMKSDLRPA
jgi:signal transduction histidine kinase